MILSLILYVPVQADQETILFTSNDTPPIWASELPKDGMGGEILHAMSDEIDVKSVIKYLPLKRLRKDTENNHVGDMENFAGQSFAAVIPILTYRTSFFYYKPNHKEIKYNSLRDLKGYTLGVMRGSLEDRVFFDKMGIRVEESNSENSLIKKLKVGRIDLCAMIKVTGIFTMNKVYPERVGDFAEIEIPRSVNAVSILIDENYPNSKEMGKRFAHALEKIIARGKYSRILETYYGKGNIPEDWFMQLEKFKHIYRRNLE